ncbi:MAG: alcohol dehydrogenase catalytic domain-containing protein [Phycisphaerae bacterium]|nr:alcohol dehydrogenase catalytic domain-containing protein [Phycisphaerae bacterium]
MKAVVLTGIRDMEICDLPEPKIEKADEVLLKIEKVGVCGSDVHYYETGRIGSQVVKFPFIVGHECAATVVAVGDNVKRLKAGDRVVVDPAISCSKCDQCLAGRKNTCRNLKFLGCPGQTSGCLCEYIVMPQESCFSVSTDFSFERGVLCEPLAIGLYAVKQAKLKEGANIAILGAGPIGLSCLVCSRYRNVGKSFVTDKISERITVAQNGGASWTGNPDKQDIIAEILKQQPDGVDAVFECAGQQETMDQAIEILKPGGKLMLIGIPREDRVTFVIDKMRRKELTVVNVRRQNEVTQECIDLVGTDKIDVDFMITHRFAPEQSKEAFELVANYSDGVVKALIEF